MYTDRCGNTCRPKCRAKGSEEKAQIEELRHTDRTNVEPEMYDHTSCCCYYYYTFGILMMGHKYTQYLFSSVFPY